MLSRIVEYLNKNLDKNLSINIGTSADTYPALLIAFQNLEFLGQMHENVFLLKLKLLHIEDTYDQIAFLKLSQQIYQCLKDITKHEEKILGVSRLTSCFKKHEETFINEFEYEVVCED